ncbi:hypothetical protein ONZ51_g13229 [Trametes cubensis]|uniref:Uncharacterized protein n=1 Tax=Trametes cubensis TaxID=1111947 RepID=A0AAD7TET3_9APHY|nr:hypothetical protein ONZ51_g13229 [Trametes cubensis]
MEQEQNESAPCLGTQQLGEVDGWLVPAQAVPTPRPRDLPPNLRYVDEADDVYLPLWSVNESARASSPHTRAPTPGPSAPRRPAPSVSRALSDSSVDYFALAEEAERTAEAIQPQQQPSPTASSDPDPYQLAAEAAGFDFMPEPEGGFPPVNFSHPFALYNGQTRARTAALEADSLGPNVLIQVAGEGYPQLHRLNHLMETLGGAVQAIAYTPCPLVSSPAAELSPTGARRTSPNTWVILNISQDAADRLIHGRVWISPAISFFAYGRPSQTQRYLFTLTGFRGARDYQVPIEEAVRRAFRTPAFVQSTTQLLRTNPDFQNVSIVVALHRILTSIAVRITPLGNGNLIASVDCDSPTRAYEEWRHWRDVAVTLSYETLWHGQGTPWRNPSCAVCHGADHPTHLCPFPRLPGWSRDSTDPHARTNCFLLPPLAHDTEGSMAPGAPDPSTANAQTNTNTRPYGNARGAPGSRANTGQRGNTNPRGNQSARGGANGRTPAPTRSGRRPNDDQPNKRTCREEDRFYD